MNWLLLVLAGLFEVGFTFSLGKIQNSDKGKVLRWYICFLICSVISIALLVYVSRFLPIGSVYAVWTGIGAVGTVLVGILFFNDKANFWRIFFISTLIVSIIGLKVVSH